MTSNSAPRPLATLGLALLLLAWQLYVGGVSGAPEAAALIEFGARKANMGFPQSPWRLLASLWLHANWLHLGTNLLMLGIWGACLERLVGAGRMLLVFTIAGLWSSLFSDIWGPDALAVGASGAVFGLLSAVLVMAVVAPEWPEWGGEGEARRWVVVSLAAVALNAVSAIGFSTMMQGVRLDHWAHGGGAFVGAVIGLLTALSGVGSQRDRGFWVAVAGLVVAAGVTISSRGASLMG